MEGGRRGEELAGVDPAAARRLAPADAQRILRALEVWEATGRPLSSWQRSGHGPLDVSDGPPMVLLLRGRDDLSRRIAIRCEAMISGGLESEIRGLLGAGLTPDAPAFKTLGYAEWLPAVLGERSRDDAMDLFVRNTRRYARRQTTWFRNRYRGQRVLTVAPSEDPAESSGRVGEDLGADWGRGGA
jgi:tRNA dimethylallyltransferase